MFYAIFDTIIIGSLVGIMTSILFEKNIFPLKTNTALGIIGSLISFLAFEMISINGGIFQIGLATLIIIFTMNIIGRININTAVSNSSEYINELNEVRRSK
jgi:uncharacterized membrane protein YeaQ/YmgE (transglycosylase-associated protein family)